MTGLCNVLIMLFKWVFIAQVPTTELLGIVIGLCFLMGVDIIDIRARVNSIVHFRPVSAYSLASLLFRITY